MPLCCHPYLHFCLEKILHLCLPHTRQVWSCLHLSLALARKVWSLFCTFVWHLLDRSADGGWISLGFIIILMNYWSIGGIFNFILLKIWILHNKVVTSKKKIDMESPYISFYSFFRLSFAGSAPFSRKKNWQGFL